MGRILCGADASQASGCAAALAACLDHDLNLESVLVHVESSDGASRPGVASIARARERGRLRALVDGHGFPDSTHTEIATGDPAEELVRAAAAHNAELIVVGARGGGAPGPPLGGVSARLIRRAPCPVVIVPSQAGPPYPASDAASLFCAVQESARESDVLRLGADLADRLGGRLHAAHAVRGGLDDPVETLLALAEETCADMIVVGAESGRWPGVGRRPPLAVTLPVASRFPVVVLPAAAQLVAGSGHYELGARAA